MTIELKTNGFSYRNIATVSGDPAFLLSGSGSTFTNADSGRAYATSATQAAIAISGAGATIINEEGGIISAAPYAPFNIAITGSANADTVVNAGLIAGRVDLGDGADRFVENGSTGVNGSVLLGAGDDAFEMRGSGTAYSTQVDGGDGDDTLTIDTTNGAVYSLFSNFEHLIVGGSAGNLVGFSGYQSIVFAGNVYVNFVDSSNPGVSLSLAGVSSLSMSGSSIKSVTGTGAADNVFFTNRVAITDSIDLGSGDDSFSYLGFNNGVGYALTVGGVVDGGAGYDRLNIEIETGATVDLAPFRNFENLDAGGFSSLVGNMRITHASGFVNISAGPEATAELRIAETDAPSTNVSVYESRVVLESTARIGSVSPFAVGFAIDYSGIAQGSGLVATIINAGTVLGDVKIGLGDDVYDGSQGSVGGTIYGYAGNDTLTGGAAADRIDGGYGADVIVGGAGGDKLTGGPGADIFRGTIADFRGDTITDFGLGDTLHLTDASPVAFAASRDMFGHVTLSSAGSALSAAISATNGGRLVVSADPGGGVDVRLGAIPTVSDFDGNGHADILWRNQSGAVSVWAPTGNGSQYVKGSANATVATSWSIVDSFDWNGDGFADVLWRNKSGAVAIWKGAANQPIGAAQDPRLTFEQGAFYDGSVGTAWSIAGAGDIDGDGKGDLLWRNADGALSAWKSTGDGFARNSYSHAPVDNAWKIEGVGDFNGDGRADILWRNVDGAVSTWNAAGIGFNENSFFQAGVGTSWHVAGIGDINGDSRDDILWFNDSGAITVWQGGANGFTQRQFEASAPPGWHVAQLADTSGDGKDDIVWRSTSGELSIWESTGSAWHQNTYYDNTVGNNWQIAAHQFVI